MIVGIAWEVLLTFVGKEYNSDMNHIPEDLLPEDQILIEEFVTLGLLSEGSKLEEQKRKMLVIQTKAILRSRKTMIDLDKSNRRFSIVVGCFALLQVVIAVFQFSFDVMTESNKAIGYVAGISFFGCLFFMIYKMDRDIKNK